jgi:hypothetical protein
LLDLRFGVAVLQAERPLDAAEHVLLVSERNFRAVLVTALISSTAHPALAGQDRVAHVRLVLDRAGFGRVGKGEEVRVGLQINRAVGDDGRAIDRRAEIGFADDFLFFEAPSTTKSPSSSPT